MKDIKTLLRVFLGHTQPHISEDLVEQIYEGKISNSSAALPEKQDMALVLVDPVGIQELIFISHRLITARHASLRLGEWDNEISSYIPKQIPYVILFSGGGQALLLCKKEDAVEIIETLVEAFYDKFQWMLVGTQLDVSLKDLVSGGSVHTHLSAKELSLLGWKASPTGFGSLVAKLASKLQIQKDNHSQWRYQSHNRKRCWESGFLPATKKNKSDICRNFRSEDLHDDNKDLDYDNIAYLYLDGTSIGLHLQNKHSIKEYHSFSQALIRAFGRKETSARLARLGLADKDYVIGVCGGDDLQIAFDAKLQTDQWKGPLELLQLIIQDIHNELDQEWAQDSVGLGAGLAIGSGLNAPFGFRMARKLCAHAKTISHKRNNRSAIDFDLFYGGSIVADSISSLRTDKEKMWYPPLQKKGQKGIFSLTEKPYSFDDLSSMVTLAKAIDASSIGKGIFYRIRTLLEDDPLVGVMTATYLLSKINGTKDFVIPTDKLGTELLDIDTYLIRKSEEDLAWSTKIPDIVEVITLRERANKGETSV